MPTLLAGIAFLNACGIAIAAATDRAHDDRPSVPGPGEFVRLREGGFAETFRFFRAWARDPLRIASVAPSSNALARLMTREIGPDTGPVIELGPGTGPFTRALLARGVSEADVALVESDEGFANSLAAAYPVAQTLWTDAARIDAFELFDGRAAGAVISGLPLLSMSGRQVEAILRSAFGKLEPAGAFYQFTYGPRCPVPKHVLASLDLMATRVGWTFANLPPATVYRLTRNTRGTRE